MRSKSYPTPDAHFSFLCVGLCCDHVVIFLVCAHTLVGKIMQ